MSYIANRHYKTPYSGLGVLADLYATGSISCGAGGTYADGDTVAVAGHTFEIDVGGGGVTPGNVAVVITGAETAQQIRTLLLAALQSDPTFPFSATAGDFDTVVDLRMKTPGPGLAMVGTGGFAGGVVAGFTGGQLGNGQPARFGPVRAIVPAPADNRVLIG